MIKLIDINKIHHHPDNPRKDLGDLTELAASIKQSGILQNLSLVPWFYIGAEDDIHDLEGQEEKYYAVIGNRRLAASKLAGLTEIPCAVLDMDHRTQVETMLVENMQRSDLTVYEQAQGFQMMINFGESVTDISDRTGLSESTVRRRVKLLDLDQDKLKESSERGGTLTDYVELEKIEDIKLRNEILEAVGTSDFNYKLKTAINKEKQEKAWEKAIEILRGFAIEIEKSENNMSRVSNYSIYSIANENVEVPEDSEDTQYYFTKNDAWITLYKHSEVNEEQDVKNEELKKERAEREERIIKLKEIAKRAYELRSDFIKGISNTKARKNLETIIESTLYQMIYGHDSLDYEDLAGIMDIDISDKVSDEEDVEWKDIASNIWKQPELYLLKSSYSMIDGINERYFDWNGNYRQNEDLDYAYKFLKKLGYKMSEEEIALQEGTHELFKLEG